MDRQALIGQLLNGTFHFHAHHPLTFDILIKSLQNTHFLWGLLWISPKVSLWKSFRVWRLILLMESHLCLTFAHLQECTQLVLPQGNQPTCVLLFLFSWSHLYMWDLRGSQMSMKCQILISSGTITCMLWHSTWFWLLNGYGITIAFDRYLRLYNM